MEEESDYTDDTHQPQVIDSRGVVGGRGLTLHAYAVAEGQGSA